MRREPNVERRWMEHSSERFLDAALSLDEHALDLPSRLPGWSRRHVIAHVHFNAEALRRLVGWAATGVEQRMYASADQRTREIESGAALPAEVLRRMVVGSAAALATEIDGLSDEALGAEVVTAQGRVVPASEVVWLRTREVAIHLVDLDCGYTFEDLPRDLVRAIVVDAAGKHATAENAPDLAAWLTGRAATAPVLGAWL